MKNNDRWIRCFGGSFGLHAYNTEVHFWSPYRFRAYEIGNLRRNTGIRAVLMTEKRPPDENT